MGEGGTRAGDVDGCQAVMKFDLEGWFAGQVAVRGLSFPRAEFDRRRNIAALGEVDRVDRWQRVDSRQRRVQWLGTYETQGRVDSLWGLDIRVTDRPGQVCCLHRP